MQKHTKNYFSHFGFVESDFIKCENCSCAAVDIHHIKPRSSFGSKRKEEQDHVSNLIALCRKCHDMAHDNKLTKEYLQEVHNQFLTNK